MGNKEEKPLYYYICHICMQKPMAVLIGRLDCVCRCGDVYDASTWMTHSGVNFQMPLNLWPDEQLLENLIHFHG